MVRSRKLIAVVSATGLLVAAGTGVAVAESPGGDGGSTDQATPVVPGTWATTMAQPTGATVAPKAGQPDSIALVMTDHGPVVAGTGESVESAAAVSATPAR
jgi:hypothetical protein